MKTAISVPDELHRRADRLAKRKRWSRSRLYSEALARYIETESEDDVVAEINRVYGEVDSSLPPDIEAARNRALADDRW